MIQLILLFILAVIIPKGMAQYEENYESVTSYNNHVDGSEDDIDDDFSEDEEKEIMEQEANIITTDNNMSIDTNTGEILNYKEQEKEPVDNELIKLLYNQFDGKMEVRI